MLLNEMVEIDVKFVVIHTEPEILIIRIFWPFIS